MIYFTNEQTSIIYNNKNGCTVIRGAAGSGKTLVAVERAIFLATEYIYADSNDKILFTFYNKSLQSEVEKLFLQNEKYEKVKDKIIIKNIDAFISDFLRNNENFIKFLKEKKRIINTNDIVTSNYNNENKKKFRIKKILENNKKFSFKEEDIDFILEEINWLRQLMIEEEYIENIRVGRGSKKRLDKNIKNEIKIILREYRKKQEFDSEYMFDWKRTNYYIDYYDFMYLYLYFQKIHENFLLNTHKINHIIIDEAQDFSRMQFEFIKLLCPITERSPNTINLFLDGAQSIYNKNAFLYKDKRTIKQLGFSPLDNKKELKTNFRNIKEIFSEAKKLISMENDNEGQDPKLYETDEVGMKPFFIEYNNFDEEIEETYQKIRMFINEYKYRYSDITIISPENINKIYQILSSKGLPIIKNNLLKGKTKKEYINLSTFHSVKGTENKIVFILSLNKDVLNSVNKQFDKSIEENFIENKKLLYIGMTRSKEILIMSNYEEKAEELGVLDFNNFIISKTDDNFNIIFNKELHSSKNIDSNNLRYEKLVAIKLEEENIYETLKPFNEKIKDKVKKEIQAKEENTVSYKDLYNNIENFINEKFSNINETSKKFLLEGEYEFKKLSNEEIENKKINFSKFLIPYFMACEMEIKSIYNFIHKNILEKESSEKQTFGTLINFIRNNMDKYPELKQIVKLADEKKIVAIRNNCIHPTEEIYKIEYEEVAKLKEFILNVYIKKILNSSIKLKANFDLKEEIIEGTISSEYNKINGKYAFLIDNEIMAISSNFYPINKKYKFSGKYRIIKGNRIFLINEVRK